MLTTKAEQTDRLLRKCTRVAASLGGQLSELVMLLRREMYFHKRSLRVQLRPVNGPNGTRIHHIQPVTASIDIPLTKRENEDRLAKLEVSPSPETDADAAK